MVKLQWPLTRRKDEKKQSDILESQLRTEGALTQVKATEYVIKRNEFTDDFLANMCKVIDDQVKALMKNKSRSVKDEELLSFKTAQLINFEAYRALKRAGMQWSVAGEDTDMSERYSAYEQIFCRNWNNPVYQELLYACAMYLLDISYKEKHVEPAPTVIFQTLGQSPRISLGDFGHGKKETQ